MSDNVYDIAKDVPFERKPRASKSATMELVVMDNNGVLTVAELIEFAKQLKDAKIPGDIEVRPQHDTADDTSLLVVKYDPSTIPTRGWGFRR